MSGDLTPATLKGGPFDGRSVDVAWGSSLVVSGEPLEDGRVARYRPSRTRGVYSFRGLDRVIARIPETNHAPATRVVRDRLRSGKFHLLAGESSSACGAEPSCPGSWPVSGPRENFESVCPERICKRCRRAEETNHA